MALNFLGLGFTFGAKDAGLSSMQEQISKGFESMFAHVEKLGKASSAVNTGEIIPPNAGDNVDKMSEALDGLSTKLGDEFPEASRKGTEQFHRDSSSIESDERRIGGGFNFIRDAVEKLNVIARQNKLQTFVQAISLSKLNDIAGSIGEIGTQGMNLTTSFEATMVASAKSSRQMGANYGYVGKELSKFTSKATGMSIALNIGAEEASQALRGYMEATSEMGAIGIKSAADLAKFSAAYGVNADVLRNSTLRMRNEFQMSDDQINQVMGSWAKMGQITGDVGGALNTMPQIMDQLRRRAAMMGKELDPKELADYAASTAGLAAAFMQAGQSSEQARENAVAMSEQMLSSKENFKAMFAGAADDLDQFQQSLGIAFGDIGVSMEMMGKGPGDFIAGLAGMIAEAKKTGRDVGPALDMIRGQLAQTIGPDKAAELVNFFRTGDAAAIAMMKDVAKTPANFGKMAKEGFRTGRTLAESFELAKDSFIASFRSIGRVHARAFVKDTTAEFKKFNKSLRALVKKGGPMGMMVEKMSEIHQLGTLALIPKTLRPMASVFGEMVSQMTPAITAMGALGFRLKSLANPFFLVAGAAGGLFALFKSNEKTIAKQDKAYQTQLKVHDKLEKALKRANKTGKNREQIQKALMASEAKLAGMREKHAAEARTKTIQQIEEAVSAAVEKIGMFGSILFQKMQEWWPYVEEFMVGLWDGLISGVDPEKGAKGPAAQWGLKLGESIRTGIQIAIKFLKDYFKEWWSKMTGIWTDDSKPFLQKVKETIGGSAGIILGGFALAKFTPVFGVLGTLAKIVGGPLTAAFKLFGKTFMMIPGPWMWIAGFAALGALFERYPDQVNAVFNKIGDYAAKLGEYLVKAAALAIQGIAIVLSHLPEIFYKAFIGALKAAFGILDGIKKHLQEKFPQAFYVIEGLFWTLKAVATVVIAYIFASWIAAGAAWIKDTYVKLGEWVAAQWAAAKKGVKAAWTNAKGWIKSIGAAGRAVYKFITETLVGWVKVAAKGIWSATTTAASWIYKAAAMTASIVATGVVFIAQFIAWAAKGVWSAVTTAASWLPTLAAMTAGMIATAVVFIAQFIAIAAAGVAAAIPVLIAWAPFILLAVAIAAAVYGIIKAWKYIVKFFEWLWDGVVWIFKKTAQAFIWWITMPLRIIKAAWGALSWFFGMLWDGIKAVAGAVWDGIKAVITSPIDALKAAWNAITGFFSGLWDGIKNAAKAAWDWIKNVILAVPRAVKAVWEGFKNFLGGLWDGIKSAAKAVWGTITDILLAVPRALKRAWSGIKGFFGGIWDGLKSGAKGLLSSIGGALSSAAGAVTSVFSRKKLINEKAMKNMVEMAAKKAKKIETNFDKAAEGSAKSLQKIPQASQATASQTVQPYVDAKDGILKAQKDLATGVRELTPGIVKSQATAAQRSVDASAQGVVAIKQHTQAMKAHVDAANALVYPKMETDVGKLAKAYREAEQRVSQMAAAGRGATDAYKEAEKAESEARKAFREGARLDMNLFESLEKSIRGRLNLSAEHGITPHMEALKYLQTTEQGYLKVLEAQREKEAQVQIQAGIRALQQLEAGEITREEYEKIEKAIEDASDATQTLLKDTAIYLADMPYYFEQSTEEVQKNAAAFSNAMVVQLTKEYGSMTNQFTSLTEEQRGDLNKMRDQLLQSAKTRMVTFLQTTTLTGEELAKKLQEMNKNAADEMNAMYAEAERLNKASVGMVPEEAQRAWEQAMSKHEEKIGQMAQSTSTAASEAAAEIEKVSGLSGKDAMEVAQQVAEINTKKFKENIKVIREEFFALLEMMREINEGVIDLGPKVEKSFPKAGTAMDKLGKQFEKWFDDKASTSLVNMVDRTFKKVIEMVNKFRVDLLKPLDKLWDQINRRSEDMFSRLSANLKSTAKTLRSVADMTRIKGGPTEEGAAPLRQAQAKTFRSDISGEENIYRAVHWPDWYTQEYKVTAEAMRTYLQAIAMFMEAEAGAPVQGGRRVATLTAPAGPGGGMREQTGAPA